MAISTARSLTFTIPGSPALKVIATENNGKIDFTVDLQDTTALTGDLRGFFFDTNEAKMAGMKVTGSSLLTQAKVGANAILDLGNGDTMAAKTAAKFDVGLEIGTVGFKTDDVSGAVSFTLSNTANNLTLDDIAGQRFGAKVDSVGAVGTTRTGTTTLLATATAAPDAKDDVFTIREDGATTVANTLAGAAAASTATKAVTLNVLSNDTDGDRDVLTIVSIGEQPTHGTVAIAADGKSLLYTPTQNYSGTDTLLYGISDGKGGTDFARATITVTPVADAPVVTFTTDSGAHVNETVVHVTARLTDIDGSESISAITAGSLSAGQTLTATNAIHAVVGQAGVYQQDFLLVTPKDQSAHLDLSFTATAREFANNAVANTVGTTHVDYDYKSVTNAVEFTAYDQNMWGTGAAFRYDYDNFLGIDLGDYGYRVGADVGIGEVYAGVQAAFKVGLDTKIHINGGSVDSVADYDVTVDSAYNRTTDILQLDTHGSLTNLSVSTQSPEGSVYLAMIVKAIARAYVGFSVGTPAVEVAGVEIIPAIGISGEYDLPGSQHIDQTIVLVDANSEGAHASVTLPEPFDDLSVDFAWPTIRTAESGGSAVLQNSGDSNNFLSLNLDVDSLASRLIFLAAGVEDPPVNLFHPEVEAGPLNVGLTLYDATLSIGANFKQYFQTTMGAVHGVLNFEDGSHQSFILGESVTIANASHIDAGGNHNGVVDYTIDLVPDAQFQNQTKLGFNLGYEQTIGEFSIELETPSPLPNVDIDIGPLYHRVDTVELGEITLLNDTFAMHFQHQTIAMFA